MKSSTNELASPEAFRARPDRLLTERLEILPLSLDEFALWLSDGAEFARRLRLSSPPSEPNAETLDAMNWLYEEALKYDASKLVWTTSWQLISRRENRIVGAACFKGPANEDGRVEIGYGIDEPNRNRGYMTEAVGAFVDWAKTRPDVDEILAETEKTNAPSRRTLENNGFEPTRETDDSVFWRVDVR